MRMSGKSKKNDRIMKNKTSCKKGFSLIELMISVFVFLLIMTTIVQIFATQINAYRHARSVQNDLENAQFAMNYISKTLRTASVLGVGLSGVTARDLRETLQNDLSTKQDDFAVYPITDVNEGLIVYDFSQELCMRFTFRDGEHRNYKDPALWVETAAGVEFDQIESTKDGCLDDGVYDESREYRLTTGSVDGSFFVAPTRYQNLPGSKQTDTIGKVTVGMSVLPGSDNLQRGKNPEPVYLQSTVSLRDYPPDLSF